MNELLVATNDNRFRISLVIWKHGDRVATVQIQDNVLGRNVIFAELARRRSRQTNGSALKGRSRWGSHAENLLVEGRSAWCHWAPVWQGWVIGYCGCRPCH